MTPPEGVTPEDEDEPTVRVAPPTIRLSEMIGGVEERHHDPLDRLAAACLVSEELGRTSRALLRDGVARALESGASWTDIARVLDVSRQAAHRKYRARVTPDPAAQSGSAAVRTGDGRLAEVSDK